MCVSFAICTLRRWSEVRTHHARTSLMTPSGLTCRRLSALPSGGFLLRGRTALRRVAAPARRVRLLAAATRRARGVRDLRRALLRHALVLQRLVLLPFFPVGALPGMRSPLSVRVSGAAD